MNYSMIRYILSKVLMFLGIFFLLPAIVGGVYGEKEGWTYLIFGILCIIVGGFASWKKPNNKVFYAKEGFATVALCWVLLTIIGALPFVILEEIPSFVDAVFETMSGFTTTGSSILSDVEALSKASLFWRSFTHWVGGMGVLVFVLAFLPASGGSNMHLMRAESPGPSVGKLVPKVKRTAMILYGIYFVITIIEILLLIIVGGLDWFSSMTLTFGTVGTGGFAILNTGLMTYSVTVQVIITVFMIICSINFTVYYLLLIGRLKEAFFHEEMRYYLLIVFGSAIMITINIVDKFESVALAFHHALFQVATVTSTTGYSTVDFNLWPAFSKTILLFLMLMGACAGSTGGGFKLSRLLIICKAVKNEIIAIAHPKSVRKVSSDGKNMSSEAVKKVLTYLGAYVLIIIVSIIIISLDGKDMETNISAIIATFNNIGPGFATVGPICNFGDFSNLSKIVMTLDMMIGRLEIFPVLVLFAPGIWKRAKKK